MGTAKCRPHGRARALRAIPVGRALLSHPSGAWMGHPHSRRAGGECFAAKAGMEKDFDDSLFFVGKLLIRKRRLVF